MGWRPEPGRAWVLAVRGAGDDGPLRVAFSGMGPLSKASGNDSMVADGCKPPGMGESGRVPPWGCSGVSAAVTISGWSFVVSVTGDCGGDICGLVGIAKNESGGLCRRKTMGTAVLKNKYIKDYR